MKYLFLLAVLFVGSAAARDVSVNGYTRSNGTYVQPYHRTSPDNTISNNYSTQGNVNPYTGQPGTVPQQPAYPAYQQPYPGNQRQSSPCLYGQQC